MLENQAYYCKYVRIGLLVKHFLQKNPVVTEILYLRLLERQV